MRDAHFQDLETRAHAARLGMWVFLASEVLLFGALFVLYAGARVEHPREFAEGVRHADGLLGFINTLVLLTSSFCVAAAVQGGRRSFLPIAALLGVTFLALKGIEWSHHVRDGIVPGGGRFGGPIALYFTLYYVMTGLHAIHVVVGLGVLAWMTWQALRGAEAHRLEVGALYWHLVDVVWIFLWPLFYLTAGSAR